MALPASTRVRSAQHEATERIKAYILDHRLHAGDALPTEAELMTAIGASRSSVREAIKTLSALDIVEVRHGHGTFVGRLSMSAMVESLAFRSMLSSASDYTVLADLVSIREMLEQGLAGRIIDGFDAEQERGLSTLARAMHDLAELGRPYVEEDRQFHLLLLKPLGNELVVQLTGAFWEVQSRVAPSLAVTEEDWLRTADAHVEIVAAAAARDRDRLHAAIEEHYAPVKNHIRALAQ
ncbi:GntR family transcriptional regulator [Luteipulveratus sp. YIM 133132]|uniref:GntR family transcriptional regulator n=1 Tax=Luteipulveratus flavus TaxID=3031728 RepID=A0ABT6C1K5_9MICO|nr:MULTISPECIES: FCD domain-containing protein [unclassified Luteipulveratus]MDE9367296.1 GntR family transcriptional regulator [Luteipulveratus sp. YIM 133132]MDF8262759.1 GntR family transcriptional regulator [Luteipulveratus sp. YIM 133296]